MISNAPQGKIGDTKMSMDMSKYASAAFIKPVDLEGGPQIKKISAIEEGKFGKPNLIFDDGTLLSLNGTNVNTLMRAFGWDSEDWIDQQIELRAGTLKYNG